MDPFRERVVSGLGWSAASQFAREALRLVIGILLARLLTPDEFGLVGMIYIFTGFAALFGDLGLGAALVQRADLDRDHLDAVFWVNVGAGVALTLLFLLAAPLVAAFYDEPVLEPLTMVIALQFTIGSLNVVQGARLTRAMAFRRLAVIETGAAAGAGGIGIAMALTGFGVWSLVAQSLAGAALTAGWMWAASPWRPRASLRWDRLRELLGYSSNLLGFNVFNYWIRNTDDLLIGRVLGSAALGVYTRGYALMLMPLTRVSQVVGRVMFPALSSIQGDTDRVRDIYLRTIRVVALLTFPMMVGLLVVAEEFVLVLLGDQWAELIPLLRVFAVLGLVQSIKTTVGWIYQSQGRTDLMFRWGIVAGVIYLASYFIGIRWGMMGVAVAYTLANVVLLTWPTFAIPGRLIGLSFPAIAIALAPVLGCALAMGLAVWGLDALLPAWPRAAVLAVDVAAGVVVYGALVHGLGVGAYREVREVVAEGWRGWGG